MGRGPVLSQEGWNSQKIRTASPPPGLGVGEEHRAERVGLSLQRGEQLVLTTDGIPEAACEQYLRACGPLSPREFAAGVVACASESEPDDRTAAGSFSSIRPPCSLTIPHAAREVCRKRARNPTFRKYFLSKHKIPARIRLDKTQPHPAAAG